MLTFFNDPQLKAALLARSHICIRGNYEGSVAKNVFEGQEGF